MDGKRQKNQLELAFMVDAKGEAGGRDQQGTEPPVAERTTEDPTLTTQLMEEVCQRENLKQALKRVKANKGSAGIDGMTSMSYRTT